jgi:mono/diheme cytochrome c family protein
MRKPFLVTFVSAVVITATWNPNDTASAQTTVSVANDQAAVFRQYCVGCHNDRLKTGAMSLEHVNVNDVAADPDLWENVLRKLQRGAMPPPMARRPDQATYGRVIAWLDRELDHAAAAHPNPGAPLIHRLNRAEYANAIRDLLSLDIDVAALLPPDDSAYGFDNIADVLGLSPVLVERYVSAAEAISAAAVGERDVSVGSVTFRVPQDRSQDKHIEGTPLGTIGGLTVQRWFPVDGQYDFTIKLLRTNTDGLIGLERPHQLEISIDGERVFLETIGGPKDMPKPRARGKADDDDEPSPQVEARLHARVAVKAGPRLVTATFIARDGVDTRRLQDFVRTTTSPYDSTGWPHIRELTITGPFNTTGVGDTPTRLRIFTCRPVRVADEDRCATEILSKLARRAYRRAVTVSDLKPVLAFYASGRKDGSFETGIQRGLQRILASPDFVLRAERDPRNAAPGTIYKVGDFELASRLSFFLWSSIPDDELLRVAAGGHLSEPAILEQQVRRMLADPKAHAFIVNFAGQWLQLRNLRNVVPDPEEFPDFDDQLRDSFARETELFFESIVREDRSVLDLLTANYTFVNERLAKHYGIPFVFGTQFRRVTITDDARCGLLGQGSILTVTSHADRTAPVLRGKWILDNLLGMPPPPPPANVNTNLPDQEDGAKPLTMRQRMEAHRANPVCANCHRRMDPIGLAMENFDAVGAWRTHEIGRAAETGGIRQIGGIIDASGELYDGTRIDGVVALRQALLKRPDVIVTTLTEKLLTYALGRGLHSYDMPAVRGIVTNAARDNYRFSSLILGIVKSMPFQRRIVNSGTSTQAAVLTDATKAN